MITKFFNIQSALTTILACVGVFFITRGVVRLQNKKGLNRMDKMIFKQANIIKIDSANIAEMSKELFSIQQDADIKQQQIDKFQIIVAGLNKDLKACKTAESTCCEEVKHLEENGMVRYFVKKPLSKWYEEVLVKPENIKQ